MGLLPLGSTLSPIIMDTFFYFFVYKDSIQRFFFLFYQILAQSPPDLCFFLSLVFSRPVAYTFLYGSLQYPDLAGGSEGDYVAVVIA